MTDGSTFPSWWIWLCFVIQQLPYFHTAAGDAQINLPLTAPSTSGGHQHPEVTHFFPGLLSFLPSFLLSSSHLPARSSSDCRHHLPEICGVLSESRDHCRPSAVWQKQLLGCPGPPLSSDAVLCRRSGRKSCHCLKRVWPYEGARPPLEGGNFLKCCSVQLHAEPLLALRWHFSALRWQLCPGALLGLCHSSAVPGAGANLSVKEAHLSYRLLTSSTGTAGWREKQEDQWLGPGWQQRRDKGPSASCVSQLSCCQVGTWFCSVKDRTGGLPLAGVHLSHIQ